MLSGSFHVMSQEWRYYSREKALIHTLHLSELPDAVIGDPVFILAVPPSGTQGNGFNVPPLNIPIITPYHGLNVTKVVNNFPPMWMNTRGLNNFQSGTYGNWSGVSFSDLIANPQAGLRQYVGSWYQASTGGTFLMLGMLNWTTMVNSDGVVRTTDTEADLTTVYPLDSDNFNHAPAPQDYANAFYKFKQDAHLEGVGWALGQYIAGAGNAVGVSPSTIVDNIPYLNWIGEYLQSVDTGKDPPHLLIFRLGP